MTQASISMYEQPASLVEDSPAQEGVSTYKDRRWTSVAPFAVTSLACGLSWASGGIPLVTDFGMVMLTALCLFFLVREFVFFNERQGLGGLLLYGGVLVWFCHDYISHWLGVSFSDPTVVFTPDVIAKAAFYHCTFVLCMAMGLMIRRGKWLEKVITLVPEPTSKPFYLVIILALCSVGLSAYLLFTSENFFLSVAKAAFPWWLGDPAFTVSRTGNLNYNWGGYVAQLIQVGSFSGVIASLYAIAVTRNVAAKILSWVIWTFWTLVAYATDRRGEVVFMAMPLVVVIFAKYQGMAAIRGRRFSLRAYAMAAALLLGILVVIQIQGTFRGMGLENANLSDIQLTQSQGNNMFSEGLLGYATIPEHKDYFYNTFPGEMVVRPIPQMLFWLVVDPIPRALWTGKPIDPVWSWYNRSYTGAGEGTEGTTISQGMVGWWFFRYGIMGVIQGGLIFGWWMSVCEGALRRSAGSPAKMLFVLAFATFLFRSYRDLNFHMLYEAIFGAIGMSIGLWFLNLFLGSSASATINSSPQV